MSDAWGQAGARALGRTAQPLHAIDETGKNLGVSCRLSLTLDDAGVAPKLWPRAGHRAIVENDLTID